MKPIVQIVPRLPPPEEGVGGIALALAAELERRGFPTRFLAPAPHGAAARRAGIAVEEIPPEPAALAMALRGADRTILHYAGYGYHPRGVPRWLAAGLDRAEGALWTQFHEVWATGPPWRSSFWLTPLQRRIVGAIGDRSDQITTSLDLYADLLRNRLSDPRREISILPVISGIGELSNPLPLAVRAPRLVLFAGRGVRGRAYSGEAEAIEQAARALGLTEIWDIGPGEIAPPRLGTLTIRRFGTLPASEVSAILADSAAGFLAYPLGFLGKSSVFAAYCAHGVLPICAGRPAPPRPETHGPLAGVHFVNAGSTAFSLPRDPEGIAVAARSWYEGHSLARQTAAIAEWASGPAPLSR